MSLTLAVGEELVDRPVAVTVYRRLDPPTARAAARACERVMGLSASGAIDGYEEVVVPPRVVATEAEGAVQGLIDELEAAAAALGVSLEPAMRTHHRHNRYTDERERVDVLPVLTMVVRDARDGSVLAVAPARTGDSCLRVEDLLGLLESWST